MCPGEPRPPPRVIMPDMNAEIAAYDASIRTRLEGAVACLDGLTESQRKQA